jgi:hypothetical protein
MPADAIARLWVAPGDDDAIELPNGAIVTGPDAAWLRSYFETTGVAATIAAKLMAPLTDDDLRRLMGVGGDPAPGAASMLPCPAQEAGSFAPEVTALHEGLDQGLGAVPAQPERWQPLQLCFPTTVSDAQARKWARAGKFKCRKIAKGDGTAGQWWGEQNSVSAYLLSVSIRPRF